MSTTTTPRKGEGLAQGLAVFAGVLLATASVFQILQGIAAIVNDTFYVEGLNYTYEFDITAWGWIHVVLGCVGLGTGIGILMEQTWAWVLGIGIAALSAISNFMFMPYYPLWALVVIALDAFVIWALCTKISYDRI